MSFTDEQLAKKLQQELADEELAKKIQEEWNKPPYNVGMPIVPPHIPPHRPINTVLDRVCGMVDDNEATRLAGKYGLNVQNVSWEDNARSKGSFWGPCISDMTLQVDGRQLPVIRSPNFEDLTWDIAMDKIPLVVGNEKGGNLHTVTLKQYLDNFRNYLHKPNGWKGHRTSLLAAARDSHVVTSAQACFLPITASDETKFNVAIYNYQTRADDPAVLAIVASSKGTSAQILTGHDDQLFFNNNGEKCPFVGQRLSDFRKEKGEPTQGPMTQQEKQQNMLLIIQVPLKQKAPARNMFFGMVQDECCDVMCAAPGASFQSVNFSAPMKRASNVEDAIIKVGKSEGSFEEIRGCEIERDDRYPVRVTMQFYKATDNGVVNEDNIKQISEQIQSARKNADFIGSLVVGGVSNRPTEPVLSRNPYVTPAWWNEFWLVYRNVFPQYTEERAKDKVFSGGRFTNSTMNDAKDQLIDILSAEADPNMKPQPVWSVL